MIKYSKHQRQKEHILKNRNCTVSDVSRENGIAIWGFLFTLLVFWLKYLWVKSINVLTYLSSFQLWACRTFFLTKKCQELPRLKIITAPLQEWLPANLGKGAVTFCSGPVLHYQKGAVGNMAWRCLLCSRSSAFLLASLLTHYNSEHSDKDLKFKIRCGLDGCDKEYSKVNSFTNHVRSSHHRYFLCSSSNDTGGEPSLTSGKSFYCRFL